MASERICRICHDDSETVNDPMISPCLCRGGMRFVHRGCLNAWRGTNIREGALYACEVCGYRYTMRRAWWAQVIGSRWSCLGVSVVGMSLAVWLSGSVSARLVNLIYYKWKHQLVLGAGSSQVLFHGLLWTSLPGFYLLLKDLVSSAEYIGNANQAADRPRLTINLNPSPPVGYHWYPPGYPCYHGHSYGCHCHKNNNYKDKDKNNDDEEKTQDQKEGTTTNSTKQEEAPFEKDSWFWIAVAVGCLRSLHFTYKWFHDRASRICARAQEVIENVRQE